MSLYRSFLQSYVYSCTFGYSPVPALGAKSEKMAFTTLRVLQKATTWPLRLCMIIHDTFYWLRNHIKHTKRPNRQCWRFFGPKSPKSRSLMLRFCNPYSFFTGDTIAFSRLFSARTILALLCKRIWKIFFRPKNIFQRLWRSDFRRFRRFRTILARKSVSIVWLDVLYALYGCEVNKICQGWSYKGAKVT